MSRWRRVVPALLAAVLGCSSSGEPSSSGGGGGTSAALEAVATGPEYALVGEVITLDGSASSGAERFEWDFGDGTRSERGPNPVVEKRYESPGRYKAVLSAFDSAGNRRTAPVTVAVTLPPTAERRHTSSVIVFTDRRVAVVNRDSGELSVFSHDDGSSFALDFRTVVCESPRTVARFAGGFAVACDETDEVVRVSDDGSSTVALALPYGSRPFGVLARADALWVTLQGTGQLVELRAVGDQLELARTVDAVADVRHASLLPDGRIAVSRWRSPDDGARIALVDPDGATTTLTLAFDGQAGSDTEHGGVPSYAGPLLVSPNGVDGAVPSTQANIGEGTFRSSAELTFETTVRGVVSFVDLAAERERFEQRKQFDNRGLASAAVFSSRGDWLFVAMRGSRAVERWDVLGNVQSGSVIDAGYAPEGLAISDDDRLLFVDAFMSRELVVYDVSDFGPGTEAIARLPTVGDEPLAADILLGKRLFNDAADRRLAKDSYIACAHCHLEGVHDARTWDFTDRGEGLRNTISLAGRSGGDGPIHWSGNFDEVQDFENDIRKAFGGTGLLSDADWNDTEDTLGAAKAGRSEDLDALAAYVASLDEDWRSPFRSADGSLSEAAARGKLLFESSATGCTICHFGPRLTDSVFTTPQQPLLHDVGTLGAGSGQRLGGSLSGIDTPTLHGLWHSVPYLHDGSAPTLRDVLTTRNADDLHGSTSQLSASELDDLVAYLLSLDGRSD